MAIFKPLDMLKTPRECGLKLLEEASEACEEMKGLEKPGGSRRAALMGLCDVLQCVCNCLHTLGVTPEELDDAIIDVRARNCNRGRAEVRDALYFSVWLSKRWSIDEEDEEDEEDGDD